MDSTFGPPPLQDPFKWGTDVVMHSGRFSVSHPCIAVDITGNSSHQIPWRSLRFVGWRIGSQDRRGVETGNTHPNRSDRHDVNIP